MLSFDLEKLIYIYMVSLASNSNSETVVKEICSRLLHRLTKHQARKYRILIIS